MSRSALESAVARLSPEMRLPVTYHLGWTDAQGRRLDGSGGKGVRAALAILSAQAVGAPAQAGVPAAVAVELVHNFSLLHDDIIDQDHERRHRATVWSLWGIGKAIIAGDALLSLAHEVLVEAPSMQAFAAARRLAAATSAMIAGQAQDMAAEGARFSSLEACEKMEAAKTGALLGAASSLGAVLAGGGSGLEDALDTYGVELGLSFQAIDDVLGIWGDPKVTGKPAWSDLRQAKATLPVAAALAEDTAESAELAHLLAADVRTEEDLARAAKLVEAAGGRAYAERSARDHLQAAKEALGQVAIPEPIWTQFCMVADFVVGRAF